MKPPGPLRRSQPWNRQTPMGQRTQQLGRTSRLERSAPLRQRSPRKTPDRVPREALLARSHGRCEARWTETGFDRCTRQATDPQHRITKSRGGELLDGTGSLFHLAHLCRQCHRRADNGPSGDRCEGLVVIDGLPYPLLAAGEVRTGLDGRPVYTGPDEAFARLYPRELP